MKGTRKNHEFIPGGENIVMNCVSGGASKNLLIGQKELVLSIEHIIHGSLYGCSFDDERYFGVANYILVENYDVNIKFLQSNGPAARFFRSSLEGLAGSQYMISLQKKIIYHMEALVNFTALTVMR